MSVEGGAWSACIDIPFISWISFHKHKRSSYFRSEIIGFQAEPQRWNFVENSEVEAELEKSRGHQETEVRRT